MIKASSGDEESTTGNQNTSVLGPFISVVFGARIFSEGISSRIMVRIFIVSNDHASYETSQFGRGGLFLCRGSRCLKDPAKQCLVGFKGLSSEG